MFRDEFRQEFFVDGNFPVPECGDFFFVAIDKDDSMADLSEACSRYETDVSRANNSNIERFFSPVALICVHYFVDAKVSSVSCNFRRVYLCRSAPSA